jgi:hypothetical protein
MHCVEDGLTGAFPKAAVKDPYMPESLMDCNGIEVAAPSLLEEIAHPVPCETKRATSVPHASVSMQDTDVLALAVISAFDFSKRRW